jgi:hypothetical protein
MSSSLLACLDYSIAEEFHHKIKFKFSLKCCYVSTGFELKDKDN